MQDSIKEKLYKENRDNLKKEEDIAVEIEKKAINDMIKLINRANTAENTSIINYLLKSGVETDVSIAYKNSGLIVDEIKNKYGLDNLLKPRVLLIGGKRHVAKRPIKSAVKRPVTKRPTTKRPVAKRPLKKPTAVRAKRPVAKRLVTKRPVRAKRA
jgi:hypothetical protein